MSDYVKLAASAADQYLSALAETQETVLKSVATISAAAPPVPTVPTPAFVSELPTFKEVAEANFAFAAKLLKQQKDFTEKLFAATPATR